MTGEVQFALIVAALVGSFVGAFAGHLWTTRRRRPRIVPQPWRSPAEAEERFLG